MCACSSGARAHLPRDLLHQRRFAAAGIADQQHGLALRGCGRHGLHRAHGVPRAREAAAGRLPRPATQLRLGSQAAASTDQAAAQPARLAITQSRRHARQHAPKKTGFPSSADSKNVYTRATQKQPDTKDASAHPQWARLRAALRDHRQHSAPDSHLARPRAQLGLVQLRQPLRAVLRQRPQRRQRAQQRAARLPRPHAALSFSLNGLQLALHASFRGPVPDAHARKGILIKPTMMSS